MSTEENAEGQKPKVSVCIPAYKSPELFKRAMQSVVEQDYPNYEVIVTDDSPDYSVKEVLDSIPCDFPVIYEKNSKRLGAPRNWNRSIELASGEYVKVLHHDDWFLSPQVLSQFVVLMERNPGSGMGFSAANAYDQSQALKFVHVPSHEKIDTLKMNCRSLFFGNIIGPPSSVIFRKSLGVVFDERLQWLVDIDFYISLLALKPFAFTSDALIGVTVESPHQVTRQCENNRQVEVFEYLYLFSKLSCKRRHFLSYMKFFAQLFNRFEIKSARELTAFATDFDIPWTLRFLAYVPRRLRSL